MLEALRFVRGAVAQKDHIPILKHFRIQDERIQSYNGTLSLSAPITCDLTVQPLAETFVHAISLCDDTVSLHQTESGRLVVKSGDFKVYVDTSEEAFPEIKTTGETVDVINILDAVKVLAPVMSEDASRPWSRGILFVQNSAFVTNNIVLVEHWLKHPIPRPFGLPAMAVKELLRIDEEPESIVVSSKTVTFDFTNDRKLTSSLLLINNWPDIRSMLEIDEPGVCHNIGEEFFNTLHNLRPFTKDTRPVWLDNNQISTSSNPEDGAHFTLPDTTGMQGTWSLEQLLKLEGIADRIAWGLTPKPCPFFGDVVRGLIVGIVSAHR